MLIPIINEINKILKDDSSFLFSDKDFHLFFKLQSIFIELKASFKAIYLEINLIFRFKMKFNYFSKTFFKK